MHTYSVIEYTELNFFCWLCLTTLVATLVSTVLGSLVLGGVRFNEYLLVSMIWWSSIYMLSWAPFPLTVGVILYNPFSDGSFFTLFAYVVTVFRRIIITQRWVWRVLFLVFLNLFLCIAFLFVWSAVIGIIRRIRFVQWWVWQWWVLLQVHWYVRFSFSLWWIRCLCWRLHWSCWKFCCSC